MIAGNNHHSPGFGTVLGRIARVALGGVHTRVELLGVEWQEERLRLTEMLFWALGLLLLSTLGILFLTVAIILLFPPSARLYATAAFALLYLVGAAGAAFALKGVLKREPFCESIEQVKKDRLWLESLK
jgi:uncharacterized membrane protein YqjE